MSKLIDPRFFMHLIVPPWGEIDAAAPQNAARLVKSDNVDVLIGTVHFGAG